MSKWVVSLGGLVVSLSEVDFSLGGVGVSLSGVVVSLSGVVVSLSGVEGRKQKYNQCNPKLIGEIIYPKSR